MAGADAAGSEGAVQCEDIGERCTLQLEGPTVGGLHADGHVQRDWLQELVAPFAKVLMHTRLVCTKPESQALFHLPQPRQLSAYASTCPTAPIMYHALRSTASTDGPLLLFSLLPT